MSFLVSYAGQFKRYQLPEKFQYERIKKPHASEPNKKVDPNDNEEFAKELKHHKAKAAVQNYSKVQKTHRHISAQDAHSIMTHSVQTLKEENTVQEALQMMEKNNIHHLPILNNKNEIVGIISDRDLLKQIDHNLALIDIMQREIIVCAAHTKIPVLASVMLHEGIHSMPVVNEFNALIGIVTQTDILRALLEMNILREWAD